MPFILVMDVLNSLFAKAELEGLLRPLHSTGWRLSLYADDVALFIGPEYDDLQLTKSLLQIFGEASGLQTNLQKSCVIPIQCEADYIEVVNNTLSCNVFFPFHIPRPKLPGWKASLMSLAGQAVLVCFVLHCNSNLPAGCSQSP
jgi:hypothetical protein